MNTIANTNTMQYKYNGHLAELGDLASFPADPPGQLDVLGHDGELLGVDGAQVGVFEEPHKERRVITPELWNRSSVYWTLLLSLTYF